MESKSNKYKRLLVELSEAKNFNDCLSEWAVIDIIENEDLQCLCGKKSTNHVYYKLMNKHNKNTIITAFDCLSKNIEDLKHFATILCKQHTYSKKNTGKRMCHGCFKHVLAADKPLWQTTCSNCYSNGIKPDPIPLLNHRLCTVCLIPSIDPSKPEYVDKCSLCFKTTKKDISTLKPEQLRNCSLCSGLKIPNIKPDYIDKCDDCYKNQNEKTEKRQCKRCNKFNISMNAAKYVDKCTPCFIAAKEEERIGPMRQCIQCLQENVPESKPKYVTKCEECFKISKNENKVYVSEIPDINFLDNEKKEETSDSFKLLTAMMNKHSI
jgi:hypothetical protein